jgi:hypothetical protein
MVRPRGTRPLLRLALCAMVRCEDSGGLLLRLATLSFNPQISTNSCRFKYIRTLAAASPLFIFLVTSPRSPAPLLEFLDHFPRNPSALRFRRIAGHTHRPHPLLQSLHRQRFAAKQSVLDAKTAGSPICDAGLDADHVPKRRRNEEIAACLHQWNSSDLQALQHLRLRESQCLMKQRIRAGIEVFKVTREKHNSKRVAVAPFDQNLFSVCQHSPSRFARPIGSAESTPLSHSGASHLLFLCAFTVDCLRGKAIIP